MISSRTTPPTNVQANRDELHGDAEPLCDRYTNGHKLGAIGYQAARSRRAPPDNEISEHNSRHHGRRREGKIEIRGLTGLPYARASSFFFFGFSRVLTAHKIRLPLKDSESVAHGDLHFSRGWSHPHRVCGWATKFSQQELMIGFVR